MRLVVDWMLHPLTVVTSTTNSWGRVTERVDFTFFVCFGNTGFCWAATGTDCFLCPCGFTSICFWICLVLAEASGFLADWLLFYGIAGCGDSLLPLLYGKRAFDSRGFESWCNGGLWVILWFRDFRVFCCIVVYDFIWRAFLVLDLGIVAIAFEVDRSGNESSSLNDKFDS